jgi:hypothetical protein
MKPTRELLEWALSDQKLAAAYAARFALGVIEDAVEGDKEEASFVIGAMLMAALKEIKDPASREALLRRVFLVVRAALECP